MKILMNILVQWERPQRLLSGERVVLNYKKVPNKAGVYVFGRRFGKDFEALYVGKSNKSIRDRIRQSLERFPVMQHLIKAKNGKRIVFCGVVKPRREKAVHIVERAFIQHFKFEGHDLVNVTDANPRHYKVLSEGPWPPMGYVPRLMYPAAGK